MSILMSMQSLCVSFLAAAPVVDRWDSASSRFRSTHSGTGLLIAFFVVSGIGVGVFYVLHKQSVRRHKQRISDMVSAKETAYEDTEDEAPLMNSSDQESPELVSNAEAS